MADDNNDSPPNVSPPPPPTPTRDPPEPETFSKEYVRELRNENKGWRLKATEEGQKREAAERAAADAQAAADQKAKAAEEAAAAKMTEAEARANERIIRAELRTAALKAGMVDLDGLKLADLTEVKLNDQGEVDGADALMTKLKEAKPYLFGAPQSGTSSTHTPPNPNPTGPKKATEMTDEEYQAEKARAIKGNVRK